MDYLHTAIRRPIGKGRQREQPAHPVIDASAQDERRADRDPPRAGGRQHLFDAGLVYAFG